MAMTTGRVFRAIAMAMASIGAMFKSGPSKSYGVKAYNGQGRQAFYGVSQPKCHTQKKRWF